MNSLICFVSPIMKSNFGKINKHSSLVMYDSPLPGLEMGFPLSIFESIFTKNHYGFNIVTLQTILLQFAIGYFTYGGDRFFDSFDDDPIEQKRDFYTKIQNNRLFVGFSLLLTYVYLINTLSKSDETIPFIYLLTATLGYKEFKKNFGYIKPLYIGILWTLGSVILPCVIHDHSYDILNYPFDYLPSIFLLFASSSILDIKDIEEDKKNNITTLAVSFGEKNTKLIAYSSILLSSVLLIFSTHFKDYPIQNGIFELQNIGIILGPKLIETFNNTKNNSEESSHNDL